jgi:YggT family protein
MLRLASFFVLLPTSNAFVPSQSACTNVRSLRPRLGVSLRALPTNQPDLEPNASVEVVSTSESAYADHASIVVALGLLATATTIAPGEVWAADSSVTVILGRFVLDPVLNIGQFLMLIRVIMSWFPEVKINKMPWLLATYPTEGVLRATRNVIPPAFGVDVSPVVWIAVLSFFREILFGQQGLFNIGAFD